MFIKSHSAPMNIAPLFHRQFSKQHKSRPSVDRRRHSEGPSIFQRALVAVLSLGMIVAGPCIYLLNLNNQGWSWVFVLITTWSGMTLLLLLGHSGCRSYESSKVKDEEDSVIEVAMDKTHCDPIMETLAELGRKTNSRSVILLSAEGATWRFRTGWNSSRHVGGIVARLLEGRVPREAQSLFNLSLMDGTLSAFCTPMHLNSGHSLLLVLLNDVQKAMASSAAALSFQASLKLIREIGCASQVVQAKGNSDVVQDSQETLCCSVCERLSTQDRRWMYWGDWLHETHGITPSHTFCDSCSEWIYGLDASQDKVA